MASKYGSGVLPENKKEKGDKETPETSYSSQSVSVNTLADQVSSTLSFAPSSDSKTGG